MQYNLSVEFSLFFVTYRVKKRQKDKITDEERRIYRFKYDFRI